VFVFRSILDAPSKAKRSQLMFMSQQDFRARDWKKAVRGKRSGSK
jgi:hypothetical protein